MVGPRLLFSGALTGLAFLLVLVSALRLAQPTLLSPSLTGTLPGAISAQDDAGQNPASSTATLVSQQFPHPGILPDHPLYWLKMVRDRLQLVLTRDPIHKAKLLMLYADKRLVAGEKLITKQQANLGVVTVSKAEKYLAQASNQLLLLGLQPQTEAELRLLERTLLQHQHVMLSLGDRIPDHEKDTLQEAYLLNTTLYETKIKPLLPPILESATPAASVTP